MDIVWDCLSALYIYAYTFCCENEVKTLVKHVFVTVGLPFTMRILYTFRIIRFLSYGYPLLFVNELWNVVISYMYWHRYSVTITIQPLQEENNIE